MKMIWEFDEELRELIREKLTLHQIYKKMLRRMKGYGKVMIATYIINTFEEYRKRDAPIDQIEEMIKKIGVDDMELEEILFSYKTRT